MKGKTGKEMRQLMLAVSLSVLVLVLAIIAYFVVDIILATNQNIEQDKEKMIAESVRSIQEIKSAFNMTEISSNIFKLFNPELIDKVMSGDPETLYGYAVEIALSFYPVDYVGVIVDGELANYDTRADLAIDPAEMPLEAPAGDYETLDRLGDKEGFFVSVFFPFDLSTLGLGEGDIYVDMIIERTEEMAAIEDYFSEQRNDLILGLSIAAIVAIILSILLTTVGLRYFTRKYVVKPIEELNRTAEEIADGTFQGDVIVDEGSAYSALQGLLRSGQKVLRRMDEEMKG